VKEYEVETDCRLTFTSIERSRRSGGSSEGEAESPVTVYPSEEASRERF
jgi:hypothetical protein